MRRLAIPVLICLIASGGAGCTAASPAVRASSGPQASPQPSAIAAPAAGTTSATPTPSAPSTAASPAATAAPGQQPPICHHGNESTSLPPQPIVSGPIENLDLSDSTLDQLLALYAWARCVPAADVTQSAPGTAIGAVVAATGQEWAVAVFRPDTKRAPYWLLVDSQDGGDVAVFDRAPGGIWQMLGITGEPAQCTHLLPSAIEQFWHFACDKSGTLPTRAA
jgi:hypothetical protein